MKNKLFFISFLVFAGLSVNAQYYTAGSAKTLAPGKVSLGLSPYYMLPITETELYSSTAGINGIFGYGIAEGIDFHVIGGILRAKPTANAEDTTYTKFYGAAEAEFQLIATGKREKPGFAASFTTGVHSWQSLAGFDALLNLTFRQNRHLYYYSGFDVDYNIELETDANSNISRTGKLYYGVPAGIEIRPSEYTSLILEGKIPISKNTAYFIGAGIELVLNPK
ncbi:MAG: hypothetical protein U9N85_09285 [Bacteroidota bacterium]|nr:hypothetical protein [Bacteroidota bacterium]